jgi:hypothetical protein
MTTTQALQTILESLAGPPPPAGHQNRRLIRRPQAEALHAFRPHAGHRAVISLAIHWEKMRSRPRPAVLAQLRAWLPTQ